MITVEYLCADGTPLAVEFADEAQAARTWRLDHEHSADPATPLGAALGDIGRPGLERAYQELGLPIPGGFAVAPKAEGLSYVPTEMVTPDEMAAMVASCSVLVERHGSALGLWHEYCMPRSIEAVEFLDAAGDDVPVEVLADRHSYGMHMTMPPAFICFGDLNLLTATCSLVFPENAELVAYELTQGYDNPTLGADQALWQLGRLALEDAEVRAALEGEDRAAAMATLRAGGKAAAFFSGLEVFLAEFGMRAEAWDIACPTWNELTESFWLQLAQLADPAAPAPADALAKAAERREQRAAEIRDALADRPEELARFGRRYERIAPYVLVREERAKWQVALSGAMRHAMLRRARSLVERGALADPADILYLLPEEFDGGAELRELVEQRRADRERWKGATPPSEIGGIAPGTTAAAAPASVPTLPDDRVLRGLAASRGVATGPARIVNDLADADRVEPGDVLVCKMTAPPWTPLFGIAAAIVTDSGTLSSHPAIAAREYGIPAVLGTNAATTVIPDGAMVTVDGANGTVQVLDG